MRIRVEPRGLEARPRLREALEALACRGHEVQWTGGRERRAELAVGADRPLRVARAGWWAGAAAMVVATDDEHIGRWGPLQHLAWSSLWALGLVDAAAGARLQARARGDRVHGLRVDRVALWPEGEPASEPDPAHPDAETLERCAERALARARSGPARAALFLDRDGTLIEEKGYLADPTGVELLPGVPQALREARAAGLALVVISNQAGVGRGRFPLRAAYETMAALRARLRDQGIELDAIHFCPHAPDAGCPCRKPGTLLLERAADDLALALPRSTMVGDRWLDVGAGLAAGGAGVLVRTGYGAEEALRAGTPGVPRPSRICDSLADAVGFAIAHAERGVA